jgi:hypothetical protein
VVCVRGGCVDGPACSRLHFRVSFDAHELRSRYLDQFCHSVSRTLGWRSRSSTHNRMRSPQGTTKQTGGTAPQGPTPAFSGALPRKLQTADPPPGLADAPENHGIVPTLALVHHASPSHHQQTPDFENNLPQAALAEQYYSLCSDAQSRIRELGRGRPPIAGWKRTR